MKIGTTQQEKITVLKKKRYGKNVVAIIKNKSKIKIKEKKGS